VTPGPTSVRSRLGSAGWPGWALLLAIGFRALFPLAVLAASPHRLLPGLPRYRYNPLEGDAYGYYFGARELLDVWRREAVVVLPVAFLAAVAVLIAWRRLQGPARIVAVAWALGLLAAVLCVFTRFNGAAQIGWPLLWSIPLLPYRALGLPLDPDIAFGVGLTLSLLCNAITVAATYQLARIANLGRTVALFAASLFAFWPLISLLTGPDAAANGTWQIDLGLSQYTEPLSTALVTSALVLIFKRDRGEVAAAVGGVLLGLSVLVRLSNGLIAALVVIALLLWRERARALVVALTGLAFTPAVGLYYPESYPKLKPPVFPAHPFSLSYAGEAWSQSLLWHPAVLIVIVPIALVGAFAIPRRLAAVLGAAVLLTAAFYSLYELTPIHPRFLFVLLPMVALLWAAGAAAITTRTAALYHRER
jgi:hypothetical protein